MVPSRDLVDLALKGKECQSSVAPDIFFCEVDSSPLLREECLYIPRVLDHFSVAQDLPVGSAWGDWANYTASPLRAESA